ncbi:Inhibitor of growth protein 3 [Penicillium rolfsii]|nr:Inhibitor of growth protein 3 [Penicillium rolfsii]
MALTDETDHSGGVILDGPFDPDAQATVTDYIDYTENLPADIIRSLTLVRGLGDRYLDSAQDVHSLTRTYGQLPFLSSDERPSVIGMRKDISRRLDRAINACESAYAEACRLHDVVDRHFDRLSCIRQKLEALPKPPSREPTPLPEPTPKRVRKDKKASASTPRITLRLENPNQDGKRKKSRSRRSGIAAEHLAGFDPDSPIASTEQSDAEAELDIPPKPAKLPKKEKPRRPSSGAAVSTSNALALLKPPPDDAKIGSEDLPWMRLTEWEMTKLRKKMKKNAVWQPSEVMISRELALSGRGLQAYRAAKELFEQNGTEFIVCPVAEKALDESPESTELMNRGMKLNQAKKIKREQMAREAAANGGELSTPNKLTASSNSHNPASRSSRKRKRDEAVGAKEEEAVAAPVPPAVSAPIAAEAVAPTSDTMLQPEPEHEIATASVSTSSKSRRKSSRGGNGNGRIDAAAAVPPIKTQMSPAADIKASPPPSPTGSRRSTRSAAQPATTPTPPVTRPSSRRSAAAASIELGGLGAAPTPAGAGGRDLRIKSATPARKTPVREPSHAPSVPGPNRKRKRPAPGPVSSGQDGGAAVSYGRRKAKPGKKRINVSNSQDIRVDEDGVLEEIDANEPRYCLCGDVSFGTMICCENQDCEYVWFHLECVGLSEVPSRTAKWYCPECRVKFDKGPDGIVKGGSRR